MDIAERLSLAFLRRHPGDVAAFLETQSLELTARIIEIMPASESAGVLSSMAVTPAAGVFARAPEEIRNTIAHVLAAGILARLIRQMDGEDRRRVMSALPDGLRSTLEPYLRYPTCTAGAMMTTQPFCVPGDITVDAAVNLIRSRAEDISSYIYVVDRENKLRGVLNFRRLLLADDRGRPLLSVTEAALHAVPVRMTASALLNHAGWQSHFSLPVVDDRLELLGEIRRDDVQRQLQGEAPRTHAKPMAVFLEFASVYWNSLWEVAELAGSAAVRVRRKGAAGTS